MTAALARFAAHGYADTSQAPIARDVGITQPGMYHYFPDKQGLYEAVFESALERAWSAIHERVATGNVSEQGLMGLAEAMNVVGLDIDQRDARLTNVFLMTVPVEAMRHAELHHLLERRSQVQDREIRTIVEPAFAAGHLPAFDDVETAVQATRLVFMGWAIETFTQRERTSATIRALRSIVDHLGKRVCDGPVDDAPTDSA